MLDNNIVIILSFLIWIILLRSHKRMSFFLGNTKVSKQMIALFQLLKPMLVLEMFPNQNKYL